jgi:glycosyltransferase involved in cell wall biosynthesis
MKVSIVTPTFNRAGFLPQLYRLFAAQIHPDCELVILDDSPQPCGFFDQLADERVRYVHLAERLPLGLKRNMLAELASGEVLMHFDDDNYYSPAYVASMLDTLGDGDFASLCGWYLYSTIHQVFAYWDLTEVAPYHYRLDSGQPIAIVDNATRPPAEVRSWGLRNLIGWGLSYAYRREVWRRHPFDQLHHGEDGAFVTRLTSAGCSVRRRPDHAGDTLVIRHPNDISVVFPQYLLPAHLLRRVFPGAIDPYLGDSPAAGR